MVDGSFTNQASVVDANFEACIWRTNCKVNGSFTKSASVVDAIFEANMENKNKQHILITHRWVIYKERKFGRCNFSSK